ncbi:MAG TPA: hypothetical protein VFT66_15415 [Roseiflexaceae bacterium]|jgi:hypothetical protein|nr:hypothetical protein [Roseiflexaceae bacterium]
MRRNILIAGLLAGLVLGCGMGTWTAWTAQRAVFVLEDARDVHITREGLGATAITYTVAASPHAWRFRLGQRLLDAGWASETHTLDDARSTFVIQLFHRTFRFGPMEITEYATLVDDSTKSRVASVHLRYDVQWH